MDTPAYAECYAAYVITTAMPDDVTRMYVVSTVKDIMSCEMKSAN